MFLEVEFVSNYKPIKNLKMAKPNIFNSVQVSKPKKNVFDLTHDVKQSAKMGELVPVLVQECVPGDSWQIGCDSLIRFAPLIAPVMHRIDVSVHYFFVPNRILWENWEKFIVDANTQLVAPFISTELLKPWNGGEPLARFADYLGVPPISNTQTSANINALPFAAYQCIYNEYYRDQNLIPPISYQLNNGDNSSQIAVLSKMRNRAWEHDYFTSSLPWAQKGAAVDIPLGTINGDAEVYINNLVGPTTLTGTTVSPVVQNQLSTVVGNNELFAHLDDLQVGATTINDLRRAFRLQEWLEKNARGGTRYIENILMHFGVKSSDARLQRPEYITGVKTPVVISEVLNTAGTFSGQTATSPVQGNMAGHGVAVTTGKYGNYFCEEHGYIIGIMSVMPKTAYQQGIPKTFLKNDPLDFFWPSFAHIGEQPVQNQEIMAYSGAVAEQTFGYVPRYSEYKFNPSRVAGDFRTTLDYWHLGRKFANLPALNQTFIECTPEQCARIFAVQNETDNLYMQILHKIRAVRPMPKFGTPMF
jgi:hypothetical protein